MVWRFSEQNPSNPSYHEPKFGYENFEIAKLNRLRGVELVLRILH